MSSSGLVGDRLRELLLDSASTRNDSGRDRPSSPPFNRPAKSRLIPSHRHHADAAEFGNTGEGDPLTKPFAGVRVLEVAAWTFVPAAGAVLADLGADVVKVEPPTGDPQRGLQNLLASAKAGAANPFLEIPNRGKRSICLDLASERGREVLLDLAARPTCSSPATSGARLARIDVDDIARKRRIVYVRGSAGQGMAEAGGFDLASAWATSSMAYKMTRPGAEPIFQPPAFFDLIGGNTIAGAIGSALFHRERTGEALEVDVSLMSVGMWALSPDIMAGPDIGSFAPPDRLTAPSPLVNSYPTADDRWLYLVCLQADRYWVELCEVIGRPDLRDDPRFTHMAVRAANAPACVAELEATFRTKTLAEWRTQLAGFTGVWAPVLAPAAARYCRSVNGYLPITDGGTACHPAPPSAGEAPRPAGGARARPAQRLLPITIWEEIARCATPALGADTRATDTRGRPTRWPTERRAPVEFENYASI
jgi:formyl-CoA transferase